MKKINSLVAFFLLISSGIIAQKGNDTLSIPVSKPSFQVDYVSPTADKPQSKLWFMNDTWWAILPRSAGPSLWQRTNEGWVEHTRVTRALQGLPGQTDVWADDQKVTAVGVDDHSLTVFQLIKRKIFSTRGWKVRILGELIPPSSNNPVETATIVKDGGNNWWVASVADSKVCVWHRPVKKGKWSTPFVLAEGTDPDDICVITSLREGVGVIWSDQVRDAVIMRIHKDRQAMNRWEQEEIIEMGNKTVDDHLNTAMAPDGTLWLATKNSVDSTGKPQFVLRIRSPEGQWINKPYEILKKNMQPSRPVVIATEDNTNVFAGHKDYDRSVPFSSRIVFARVDTTLSTILSDPKIVISPDSTYKAYVDNVTGPKKPFPVDASWIVLASDGKGRVYEADLRKLIYKP